MGLALTNWPRGKAGEWNDISHLNELFFLIEYDKSVLNIMSIEYDYEKESIEIRPNMFTSFDSVYIYIEEMLYEKKLNVSQTDSIMSFNYPIDVSQLIKIRIIAYFDTLKAISKELPLEIYSLKILLMRTSQILKIFQLAILLEPVLALINHLDFVIMQFIHNMIMKATQI